MPTRLRAATALGAVFLAVAACSPEAADPAPRPTTPPAAPAPSPGTTFATPTPPRPEATPPPVPAELTEHSKEGSRAAIEYYVALYGYAKQTGDTDEFRASFTESCKGCVSAAEQTEAAYGTGHIITGDVPTVTHKALVVERSTDDMHAWYVAISTTDLVVQDALGNVVKQSKGVAADSALIAEWTDGRWIVTSVMRAVFDD